ncbi:MAG TPA: hypothetical protein VFW33_09655 [Gemmataceae bacterium]|nr:hypothetical protein [Gemmataceae bacterium]
MPLFIDRLPLQSWEVSSGRRRWRSWSALLPALVTETDEAESREEVSPRWWKFDSACAPDSLAWRFHLERAGLRPPDPSPEFREEMTIRTATDAVASLPIRVASVWLVSNIPALRQKPYRLAVYPGIPFVDRSPRRTTHLYPLLGMGAFRRARLKVEIDGDAGTVSVWTPGPWHTSVSQFVRRLPGGFATIPPHKLCVDW